MNQIKKQSLNKLCINFYEQTKDYFILDACNQKERKYIQNNLKRIITAKPKDFSRIIEDVKSKGLRHDVLRKVFVGDVKGYPGGGYKKFSAKGTKSFNAYDLAEKLDVNVCPYCNISYTYTVKSSNNKSTRPQFDHFICKKKKPIFGMSFYNLIPSCSICNASIKGQDIFEIKTHIHPYIDNFDEIKNFNIDKTLLSLVNKKNDFNIIFEDRENITVEQREKANNHIKSFALEALYNGHKDEVLELVEVSRAYNEDSFDNLVNTFKGSTQIFKDTNDVKRLLLGHHVESKDINKRPLNKLVKDISKELGLI
ncbi:hypothetical protein [Poseidonibacter lekithochrous]|uniref:hypothetical protein n=1 Tax=Poseidonibacter lekithochrous TaxID=1904463 RepID=UPI0008FC4598|nr:hypothetical protein [Poseidonibacter lekithochrous]QKJ22305.1 hypothetical protein ALEK_1025 [Poseidonibacter lekithochrous]